MKLVMDCQLVEHAIGIGVKDERRFGDDLRYLGQHLLVVYLGQRGPPRQMHHPRAWDRSLVPSISMTDDPASKWVIYRGEIQLDGLASRVAHRLVAYSLS